MKLVRHGMLVGLVVGMASVLIAAEKEKTAKTTEATSEAKMVDPANVQWGEVPPGLPPGAQGAVLSGDPSKKGMYTVRMRSPAGYKIMPHTHPTAEHITVISGTFYMGTGEKFDESAGHAMGPGSFMTMPAGTKHFAWSNEECVIQVHAEGPFVINYVNPADDPRQTKK